MFKLMKLMSPALAILVLLMALTIHAAPHPPTTLNKREGIQTMVYFTDDIKTESKPCPGVRSGVRVSIGNSIGGADKCGKTARVNWKEGKNRHYFVDVVVASYGNFYPVVVPAQYRANFHANEGNVEAKGAFWNWLT